MSNSEVRLNGFWMQWRIRPGTRSCMSGWPDIRMTGTPELIGHRHQMRVQPAWQRAVQQHRVDAAGPQTLDRGGGGLGSAGAVDILERVHHQFGDQRIVLDDENMGSSGHCVPNSYAAEFSYVSGTFSIQRCR